MEPRRIDLDALLHAHAFMRVERPPTLWEVDVLDEPFIRMLGELIVVGLLHHDELSALTLNVGNVTVGDEGPPAPGDYVAITIRGRGDWGPEQTWTPSSTEPLWSADLDAAGREASASFAYLRRLGPDEGSITVFVPRWLPGGAVSEPFRMRSGVGSRSMAAWRPPPRCCPSEPRRPISPSPTSSPAGPWVSTTSTTETRSS